jgi:hypothetical protein
MLEHVIETLMLELNFFLTELMLNVPKASYTKVNVRKFHIVPFFSKGSRLENSIGYNCCSKSTKSMLEEEATTAPLPL